MQPGSLVTHDYTSFRGVDFTNDEVNLYRSPDSLNMWKDYKKVGRCIETRPGLEVFKEFTEPVYGTFFYKVGNKQMILVHSGTKLYQLLNGETSTIYTGLNPKESKAFIYNNIWYFKDGINYLRYDGEEIYPVVGYIPTVKIGSDPITGAGTILEDVNMLSDYRIQTFVGDGKTTDYKLGEEYIDNDDIPIVKVNGSEVKDFTVDYTHAIVKLGTAPDKPLTIGQDNVEIRYKKHVSGYKERILQCNLLEVFDNRVFFSGNKDYPNTLWHSSLNDPTYVSDLDYYNEGLDLAEVKGLVAGNNALWVFKEPSQANTTIFYHNPVIDSEYGKTYPSTHSSISTGCIGKAINFGDDIVFFSDKGMEAITQDITTEQVLSHRSTLIDSRLINENDYKNMILAEYEGYLMVFIDNKVYLANQNESYEDVGKYEWFYWELEENVKSATVYENVLYIGTESGIYTLTDKTKDREVESYWTTTYDEFGVQFYLKTTNKRGCVADVNGDDIKIYAKTEKTNFELIKEEKKVKGYMVTKIKRKKWKGIQLKFSSNKPFELFSCTLQAYIGGYVKR